MIKRLLILGLFLACTFLPVEAEKMALAEFKE
jgi:hypothetical protein